MFRFSTLAGWSITGTIAEYYVSGDGHHMAHITADDGSHWYWPVSSLIAQVA